MERAGHVIVCGLQDVSVRVIEQLRAAGEHVVVVDDADEQRLVRAVAEWQVPVVRGSPRRTATLREAGIDGAAALLCLAPDDLANLDIALLARRLRPQLRVVVSLTNAAVGSALGRVTGPGSVLDIAALAAPAFVESCLHRPRHSFALAGVQFAATELVAEHAGPLRGLVGDLAPIAVLPAGGGELIVCPGRDEPIGPGDRVSVVAAEAELGPAPPDEPLSERIRPHPGRWLRQLAVGTDPALRRTLAVLISFMGVSVVLLMLGYHGVRGRMSVLDAAYFTSETVTTVGYGDFFFADQHAWLRIWAIVLMLGGATLVTISYALLTNLLVSRRLAQSLGRGRVTGLRGHVVVVGLGAVGLRVCESLLAAGARVVVVERDENNRFLGNARALDVPVVIGDSTVATTFANANLDSSRAVAVCTSDDLANIETGLAVDELLGARSAEVPVVLRVFDRQLAQTVQEAFNFSHVRSTAALAAPWFVGAALGLTVVNTFTVHGQQFLVGALTVAPHGGLAGRTMASLSARIRVIAITRADGGALQHPPRRDTRFGAGDVAYLLGPYDELLGVLRQEKRAG